MPLTVVNLLKEYPVKWTAIAMTEPGPFPEGARFEAACLSHILTSHAADVVHLRKPEATEEYVENLICALATELRRRVMLHDHFSLLGRYALRGVHLNSRNPVAPAGANCVSASCHSLEEAQSREASMDYVTLSPVFDSLSKSGYKAVFSPATVAGRLSSNVIALGGVTPGHLPELRRAGFRGSAMLGWYWQGDFESRVRAAALRLRLLRAFPLLLITDSPDDKEVVGQACRAYEGGCRWVQVRMKNSTTATRAAVAKAIMERCPLMLVCIDDDCEAVARSGAHGVHLGKQDISTAEARSIIGATAIVGRTANSLDDIRHIAAEGGVDYLGVGPFRFTTTKKNLSPVLGVEGYHRIIDSMRKEEIHLPVLAIGGITPNDIPALMKAGVDGIAVSGAINRAGDPRLATVDFLHELKSNTYSGI